MTVGKDAVKELRDRTGVSVMECKKALEAAKGDMEKALGILQSQAALVADKKSTRELGAGVVAAYIHNNVLGAMVSLSSETDFVAKHEEFKKLAQDIAMHVAATQPESVEVLLQQPYIKDESKTVKDLLSAATQKFGERVEVSGMSVLFSSRK
ncbi:hypothetical protein A2943_00330 [Candidatus Adlerbacteria bacterium RIFCSPLOWO2_01_FULL_51_16]|uniref:Elongation factor Ts n=1 Tax=Candidatus Adlerbacteria bacterium RIFCSPLOWO2_01_FULL_51_16 TaxID=1797243 RepID=A0A1F4XH43_9BACT|nr:MAG: hypothetical protein A2943_00330 [Candidatus Adlerbacteria bacterium RIFCSPLOWO2_01_FULL_51_16]